MEKRSRRRTRDLVTQAASQGLSENEIGCARISMMARSTNAPCKGRIQMRKTNPLHFFTFGLQRTDRPYTRAGYRCARPIPSIYSHSACNARPVHTEGSIATGMGFPRNVCFTPGSDQRMEIGGLISNARSRRRGFASVSFRQVRKVKSPHHIPTQIFIYRKN